MKLRSLFLSSGLLLISTVAGTAQEYTAPLPDKPVTPKMIRGGVLNGKAISLPKPAYPEAARVDGAQGPVGVQVTIDEEGKVIEAQAEETFQMTNTSNENGDPIIKTVHPALREAAETAARAAKFSPTKLSGVPIKVTGRIVYNFVAGGIIPIARDSAPVSGTYTMPAIRPGTISGGVLNGKATYLPAPAMPPAAAAVGVGGAVSVQVVVDENGMVTAASAVSGHQLLRAAAVEAAKQAQFSPTFLSGQAVKVSGVITYNFSPNKIVEN